MRCTPTSEAQFYFAQVLEHSIVNLVVWSGVRDGRYRVYEETEAANVELFRQTMGSIKKTLLSCRPNITHLDDLLIRALRLRNFLAHQYFRQRAAAFLTEDGRNEMIRELDRAKAFFKEVDGKLEPLTRQTGSLASRVHSEHSADRRTRQELAYRQRRRWHGPSRCSAGDRY